jgi:hypothetical protein
MKKTLIKLAAILLLTAAVAGNVQAQDKAEKSEKAVKTEKGSAESKKESVKGVPGHGKISAVDQNAKTVTIAGKEKDRVFTITSHTKIFKDGKPATLADAKAGDEAGLYYVQEEKDGKHELLSLRIGPKPEGKAKGEAKAAEHKGGAAAHKKEK